MTETYACIKERKPMVATSTFGEGSRRVVRLWGKQLSVWLCNISETGGWGTREKRDWEIQ